MAPTTSDNEATMMRMMTAIDDSGDLGMSVTPSLKPATSTSDDVTLVKTVYGGLPSRFSLLPTSFGLVDIAADATCRGT